MGQSHAESPGEALHDCQLADGAGPFLNYIFIVSCDLPQSQVKKDCEHHLASGIVSYFCANKG